MSLQVLLTPRPLLKLNARIRTGIRCHRLFFFAFTTILSYYYISETNVSYINRKLHRPFLFFILKLFVMGSCIFGAVKTADLAWAVGDIGVV